MLVEEIKLVEPADVDKMIESCCGIRQCEDGVKLTVFCPVSECIQIAGDFNNWQPDRTYMEKVSKNGFWQIKLSLAPGTYRYRFVADGKWEHDPFNPACEMNQFGQLNSILEVSPQHS